MGFGFNITIYPKFTRKSELSILVFPNKRKTKSTDSIVTLLGQPKFILTLFYVGEQGLRSSYSNFLLDSYPANTKQHDATGANIIIPRAVITKPTMKYWTPTPTNFEITTTTLTSFATSTIPPEYIPLTLGEPRFNLNPQESIALTYSNWREHSIYRLPGSTTLSIFSPQLVNIHELCTNEERKALWRYS
ncbi:hypothetical protein K501DRAFT_265616 [Backusella circina FSU 941]|nr:hypothetical protein K501DRAFT_265616 [Backusella circina FSU 941]